MVVASSTEFGTDQNKRKHSCDGTWLGPQQSSISSESIRISRGHHVSLVPVVVMTSVLYPTAGCHDKPLQGDPTVGG